MRKPCLYLAVVCFCVCLLSTPSRSADIEARLSYPYLSDLTRDGADFWTSFYSGIGNASLTYFFNLPKNVDAGVGLDYSVGSFRNNTVSPSLAALEPDQALLHRISLTGRLVYNFIPAEWLSCRPYIGNELSMLHWSGSLAKTMSPNTETGIGFTVGGSLLFSLSKAVSIGPDISYTLHKRLVDGSTYVSTTLTYLQTGISMRIHLQRES